MAKVDAKTYAKNVLKSAGYITAETIKGVNPTLTQFISDSGGAAKDMFQQAKDFRKNARRKLDNYGLDSETRKGIKNDVLSDFKTGKFYNPEREAKNFDAYMSKEGFSFDIDELERDLNDDTPAQSSVSDATVMSAADRIASSQQQFTGISTDKIVRNARGNAQASIAHNERMFGMVNNSLAVVNSSIMSLHQDLAQPLNTHIINSINFYQNTTTELAKQTKYLENINSILTNRYGDGKAQSSGFGKKQSATSAWEEIMGGGLPNMKKLGKFAKNRLMSSTGLDMLSGFIDPDMIRMMLDGGAMSSPIAFLATQILTSKMSNGAIGKSLNRATGTLKAGFAHTAGRMSEYGSRSTINVFGKKYNMGGIFGKLAEMLDITPKANNKMNFGNYNKGRADWTGMDSKALREVIPTQLAKIITALTGEESKIFDYNTGRWVTASKVISGFKAGRREAINGATSGFANDIVKQFINEGNAANPNAPKLTENSRSTMSFRQDFDTLMNLLASSGINPATITESQLRSEAKKKGWVGKTIPGGKQYLIDEHNFSRILKMLYRSGSSNRMRFSSTVYDARVANNKFMDQAGDGTVGQAVNGSGLYGAKRSGIAGNILGAVDNKGNTIFDYLQDYYKMLRAIDKHIVEGRGSSVRRDRRSTNAQTNYMDDWGMADIPTNQVAIDKQNQRTKPVPGTTWKSKGFGSYQSASGRERWNSKTRQFEAVDENATGNLKKAQNKFEREQEEKTSPIAKGIDKLTDSIGNFLLGPKEARGNISLLDSIKELPNKINEGMTKLIDKIKGFFGNLWTKFKDSTAGKSFFQAGKDILLSAGRGIVSRAKDVAGSTVEAFTGNRPTWAGEVGPSGAYRGGQVRKSGMISVSEGEYIVPAERNPYYNKPVNKFVQRATESRNYRSWIASGGYGGDYWGAYAKGGKVHDPAVDGLSDSEKIAIDKAKKRGLSPEKIAEKLGIDLSVVKNYIFAKDIKNTGARFKNDATGAIKSGISKFKDSDIGQKVGAGIDNAMKALFGDETKYKNAKDTGKEALSTLKKNLPKSMAGGAIGALIGGALTGSGLGLLGGFVIGAGSIVINNSDKITKQLFGEQDENGDWSGGKIPPKAANFIKKRVPSLAKSGGLGSVLGLLGIAPGGLLGGFVLGAGLDLLSTTGMAKDILFGKEDVNGERNGGVVGLLRTRVIDPLANFVKEGMKNIGGYLKKNFIDPVVKIFDPLKDWVKGFGKNIGGKIADAVKTRVSRTLVEIADTTIGRGITAVGKLGKKGLKAAGGIASLPFKAVGKAADSLAAHNVRLGYSSADAAKRAELGEKLRGLNKSNYEKSGLKAYNIAARDNLISEEDYANANIYSRTKEQDKKALLTHNQNTRDKVVASLKFGGMGNPKDVKEITKLFNTDKANAGDYSDIYNYLKMNVSEGNMTNEKLLKVQSYLKSSEKDFKKKQDDIDLNEAKRQEFEKKTGLKLSSGKLRRQFLLDADKLKTQKEREEAEKKAAEEKKKLDKQKLDNILEENPIEKEQITIDRERNDILGVIKGLIGGIGAKLGVKISKDDVVTDDNKSNFDDSNKGDNIITNNIESNKPNSIGNLSGATGIGANFELEHKEGEKRQNTTTGLQEEYRGGKWVPDKSDSETKQKLDADNEDRTLRNKFFSGFINGGILASLKGLFNSKDDKGEKKETFLDKIKKFLIGEDGIFGSNGFFSNLFGPNSVIGGVFSSIFGAGGLGTIIKGALTTGVVSTALVGAGGAAILNKVSDANAGNEQTDDNMKGYKYASEAEKAAMKQAAIDKQSKMGVLGKTKHGMDVLENKLLGKNMSTYKQDDFVSEHTSNRINKTILTNTLIQGAKIGSVANAVTGKLGPVGNILNPAGLVKKVGAKVAKKAADAAVDPAVASTLSGKAATAATKVIPCLTDKIKKVIGWACQKLGIKGLGESADDIAATISTKMAGASSKLAEVIPIVGWVIYGAKIVNAITIGIQPAGAKVILGILDEPTLSQKLLAALVNGINAAIPGIGGIIPTEWLVTLIYNVLSKCGVDFGDFAQQRENAKAAVDQYNAENGTTYNLEEYLFNVLDEATVQNRIKKAVGDTVKKAGTAVKTGITNAWTATKSGLSTAGAKIAEGAKGAWNATKTGVSNAWNATKTGVKNAASWVGNTATKAWEGAKNLGSAVVSKVGEKVDYLKDAWNALSTMRKKMDETLTSGGDNVIQRTFSISADTSENNPLKDVVKTIGDVSKISIFPQLLIKNTFKNIYNKAIKPVIDAGVRWTTSGLNALTTASESMKAGDLSGLWNSNSNENEEGFWGTLSNIQDVTAKVALTLPTAIVAAGKKIKEGFNTIKDGCIKIATSGLDSLTTAKDIMKTGSLSDLWSMNSSDETGAFGFVSDAQDLYAKFAFTLPTAIVGAGKKIKEGFNIIKEKAIAIAGTVVESHDAAKTFKDNGDLKGLWLMDSNTDSENPLGFLSTITDTGYKLAYTMPTAFNAFGNKIKEVFNEAKDAFPDVKSLVKDLWSYKDSSKDMSGYSSTLEGYKSNGAGLFGTLGDAIVTVIGTIMRPIVNVARVGGAIADTVGDTVEGVKDAASWAGDKVSSGYKAASNWVSDKATKAGNWVSNAANSAVNWMVGNGSGVHVAQRGNLRRFGGSTISENGCGPAAAATVLRAYGRNADINSAATYAESNGYVAGSSGVGTRASYFGDILGSRGIKTAYTSSQGAIRSAVGSGNPTILLGQDKSNRSKANSPFGPNPHYVVARGSDSRGNVIIDDPELRGPAIYNKNILNKTKLGVMTGGDSGIQIKESDGAVWNYLKSAGLSDAGAAGLMGNLYAESGITFNKVEGASIKKNTAQSHDYQRDHGMTYDSASYTAAVDKGKSQGLAGSEAQNEKPTFGIIPKYEFIRMPWKTSKKKADGTYWGQNGYGLVQWTSFGRKEGLYNLAKSKNVSIADPAMQLEYLMSELSNSYPSVLTTLKSANDVKTASNKVLIDFEAPASKNSSETQNLRAGYGNAYYKQFTSSPPTNTSFGSANVIATVNGSAATNSSEWSNQGTSSTSTSGGITDIGSLISTAFKGAFGAITSKIGGVAGKVLGLITGGLFGNSSSSSSSAGQSWTAGTTAAAVASNGSDVPAGSEYTAVAKTSGNSTQENSIVDKMNSILGKCSYSMSGARNPEAGSADCSSTVQWVLKKTIGKDPGGDTSAILNSSNGVMVDKYSSGDPLSKNSSGPNLNNLRPGDLMLYSRPDSGYSSGRKYRVGHVEMYMGNGLRAGHGGGTGPKVTNATSDASRYIMSKRYTDSTGTGSGIPLYDFTRMDTAKYTGGASNLLNKVSNAQSKLEAKLTGNDVDNIGSVGATNYSAAKGFDDQSKKLDEILLYLKQMAANTAYNASIPTIVELIGRCISVMGQMNGGGSNTAATQDAKTNIDREINSMMSKLEAISKTL